MHKMSSICCLGRFEDLSVEESQSVDSYIIFPSIFSLLSVTHLESVSPFLISRRAGLAVLEYGILGFQHMTKRFDRSFIRIGS